MALQRSGRVKTYRALDNVRDPPAAGNTVALDVRYVRRDSFCKIIDLSVEAPFWRNALGSAASSTPTAEPH